ncbi:hypothetical protein [Mucilaginibacter sp.]|uniref:hypothetical protein n=1 Tax=Mucilaginibacter sp. TaxID=1882438 RepID=UPI000CBF9D64|nr:hypothetical protein [Mucilaginibacter sp.]PLW89725.1 MAG: hypothetical protein C0154_10105 [Mucilaginibacter sp.]PMP66000.1 MAG: hypothetical protein C0191_01955 [Mucilaginibacter sp.]HEK22347.1 hypothetical protein [Bacteroidota bacterium]
MKFIKHPKGVVNKYGLSTRKSVLVMNLTLALTVPVTLQSVASAFPLTKATVNINKLVNFAVVKGKVVDENGAPLPGVSVSVKGTSGGGVTDAMVITV